MSRELSRLEISVFCPVEMRLVEFVYVSVEGAADLAWCQDCFLVAEVPPERGLLCPKTGQRPLWRR